ADLDVRMIDVADRREALNGAIERAPRLVGVDAERLDRDGHVPGGGDVARALQALDDAGALRVPRDVGLHLTHEADEVRRAELFRHLDALLDLAEERILRARFREAGRPAGIARADDADALQARFLLSLHHRGPLRLCRGPEAIGLEAVGGDGPDAVGFR